MSEEHITNDIGRVVPLHRGEYVNETQYEINDIVSYLGSTYWKFTGPKESGVLPTDTTKWRIVTNVTDAEEYVEQAKQARNEAVTAKAGAEAARDAASTSATNAATSATNAGASATTATEQATIATNKATEADSAKDDAIAAKNDAITAKNDAINAKVDAVTAKTGAENAKESAATFAQSAETSATNAATSATQAGTSATQAGNAKDAAVAAKTDAETAQTGAVSAKNDAIAAKTAAQTAQTAAETAQGLAEDAAEEAQEIVGDKINMEAVAPKWVNTQPYKIGNLLTYLGKQYYCIADAPAGTLPTNTTYFEEKSVADIVEMIKNGSIVTGHSEVADNLTPYSEDSGTTQENPFISQGTGTDNNSVIVTTGVIARQLEKQGNTVPVTQLLDPTNFRTRTTYDVTITNNNDGTLSISGTAYTLAYLDFTTNDFDLVTGHKYILMSGNPSIDVICYDGNLNRTANGYALFTASSNSAKMQLPIAQGVTYNGKIRPVVFDITGWNADIITDLTAHPEHFSWYYNGSLAYDAGSLKNCNGRYLECGQGRQLWDEEWESGYLNSDTGGTVGDSTKIRSKNYCMCVPNTVLFAHLDTAPAVARLAFYDASKNYLGSANGWRVITNNGTIGVPANAYFFKITYTGTDYSNKCTISLYYTAEQGGEGYREYYPYVAPIRIDTGNETLKAFDKKLPSGVIERNTGDDTLTVQSVYVRESNLNCDFAIVTTTQLFDATSSFKCVSNADLESGIGSYTFDTVAKNNVILVYSSGNKQLAISVPKGTTLEQAQALFDNKQLQYTLADSAKTTEQGTPFSEYAPINDYSYMAWFDTDGNLVSIPQGCKLFYPVDYKGFTDDLVMYTNGDATALAKNEDITDTALNARGYYKMQDLLSVFGIKESAGGMLRHMLVNKVVADGGTLAFADTDYVDMGDLDYQVYQSNGQYIATGLSGLRKRNTGSTPRILATVYKTNNPTDSPLTSLVNNMEICEYIYGDSLYLKNTNVANTTELKAAMKGILLAYEKE